MPDPVARRGGVGRDDGVDASRGDAVRDRFDAALIQVRRNFHRQRNALSVLLRQ